MMTHKEGPGAALAALRWAKDTDRRGGTSTARAAANAALTARLDSEIDPAVTDPAQRRHLVDAARSRHYRAMQRASVAARRANAEQRTA